MKPISAYIGHVRADKNVVTKRSYWWMRTDSGKLIWPSQKYVKVEKYYDTEFSHPIRSNKWIHYYTQNEYLLLALKGA